MQQTRGTSAVASLVLGIVALVVLLPSCFLYGVGLLLPLILGILAWTFGKNAISDIDAGIGNPNERGMAVAGYVMGIIAVILSVLGICIWGTMFMLIILSSALLPSWLQQQIGV
jgi:hypothetical protein